MTDATAMLCAAAARLPAVLLPPAATVREALQQMERAGLGVLLIADEDRRLAGMLTDGDLRRALLAGTDMGAPCVGFATTAPLVLGADATPREALALMDLGRPYVVDHLPVLTADGAVGGVVLRSDLVHAAPAGAGPACVPAVIMAGGFGTRLRPLTERTPKPMLPVGDRPLLEHTLVRLRDAGVRRVHVSTHYLADQIAAHFGDGSAFGVDVTYLHEGRPLGTAGALSGLADVDGPVLVLNGDVLTGVHFDDLLRFHREQEAELTVALRAYSFDVPYGVIDCDGARVRRVREKPSVALLVNAGIYVVERSARAAIPDDRRFDMTELIQRLLDEGRRVAGYPIVEYWLDVGRPDDYARAQADHHLARA